MSGCRLVSSTDAGCGYILCRFTGTTYSQAFISLGTASKVTTQHFSSLYITQLQHTLKSDAVALLVGIRVVIHRSCIRVPAGHRQVVALDKLFTPVYICHQAV